MSRPMKVFAIRLKKSQVRRIRKAARNRNIPWTALVRRILDGVFPEPADAMVEAAERVLAEELSWK